MNDKNNYLTLTHFASKALFLGIGLSKTFSIAKESTFFSIILGIIIGSFFIFLINKYNNNSNSLLKNIFMFIILYILFILNLTEFVNLITSIYLMDMNKFIIIIPLLIIILYLNSKNISIHLKVSKILFYILITLFILGYITLIPNINYLNYLPLFNINIKNIFLAAFHFALYSSVPNIIYYKKDYDVKTKELIKNYLLSSFILLIIFLIVQGILGTELISIFKYPEYVAFKRINFLNFIQNIENFLSFFWLIISIVFLSITSKYMYNICIDLFNNKYIYPIFLFISLELVSNYLFDNVAFLIFIYNNLWIILCIILIVFLIINILNFKKL